MKITEEQRTALKLWKKDNNLTNKECGKIFNMSSQNFGGYIRGSISNMKEPMVRTFQEEVGAYLGNGPVVIEHSKSLLAVLHEAMFREGLKNRELAKAAGINAPLLRVKLDPTRSQNFLSDELSSICAVLNLKREDLPISGKESIQLKIQDHWDRMNANFAHALKIEDFQEISQFGKLNETRLRDFRRKPIGAMGSEAKGLKVVVELPDNRMDYLGLYKGDTAVFEYVGKKVQTNKPHITIGMKTCWGNLFVTDNGIACEINQRGLSDQIDPLQRYQNQEESNLIYSEVLRLDFAFKLIAIQRSF